MFKEVKYSELGFVIPDFDFNSENALVPVTNPSFEMMELQLDPMGTFDALSDAVSAQNTFETKRQLGFFKGALMQCQSLPDELVLNRPVGQLFETLLREGPRDVHYDVLCALCAWTGAQNADAQFYSSDGMMEFLLKTSIVALSSPSYDGDRRVGRGAVGVLRNLLFHSNECRVQFLKRRGLELFCTLYFEMTDPKLRQAIIWAIQNSTLIMKSDDKPPMELLDPIVTLLGQVFGGCMAATEATEMNLANAYVDCGKMFALRLIKSVHFENLSVFFSRMDRDTQVRGLELLKKLMCWDRMVAQVAAPLIHWKKISAFIPSSFDKKVHIKYCEVVAMIFDKYQEEMPSALLSDLFPGVMGLVKNQPLKVRIVAVDTISTMVHSNAPYILDVIVGHGIISKVAGFLESGWARLIRLGVDMLLYAVQYALDGRCRRDIRHEIDQNELEDLIDEALSKDGLPEDTKSLLELLHEKTTQLFQAPLDPFEQTDESEEDEYEMERTVPWMEAQAEHVPEQYEQQSEYESSDSVEWEDA